MTVHSGSCHCGRIAFELDAEIGEAYACNCSMCRRRGSLLGFFPRSALTLSTAEADLATYTFNQHRIRHHHCAVCGVAPFSEGVDPRTGDPMAAVNLRCVPDVDLDALKVTHFDGASL